MISETNFAYSVRKIILASIISFCCPVFLIAQDNGVVEIKNIPREGIFLDKGWKYKLGDNPERAMKEYNDQDWNTIDPTPDIHNLPILWKDSVVWFRVALNIDSTQIGNLTMTVSQGGASELYLDGRLIERFGEVSQIPGEIVAYNPNRKPVSFPANKPGIQILAVRYALEPNIRYTTEWDTENLGISITLNTFENANRVYHNYRVYNDKSNFFRIAAYVILAILYLAFYVSDRRQRTSLYFFVYALMWAVIWSLFQFTLILDPPVRYLFYLSNLSLVLQVTGWLFCLTAIYDLLKQRKNWIFYSLSLFGVVCIPLGMFIYGWGWLIYAAGFITLANIDITRIAFLASRRKWKGAWILLTGAMLCLTTWVIFLMSAIIKLPLDINPWFIFSLNHLTIPVAVSIYLGYDFALTNRSLEQKLVEVQTLSKEKSQILFSQNEMLEKQVSERTAELKQSLNDLKLAQAQLIQSEKMASLGELTAGIAHEIQNPLNFVNNFSEINKDLIDELQMELKAGKTEDAFAISNNIKENEQKILHHGKRADAIVKGMRQHSRAGAAKKEPTDINSLADEYLRLSYHGLRARDKTFNATLKTDFDESIGKIDIVPQDIGRVLLNLINNAFYAVSEKKNEKNDGYEPMVTVSTKKTGDHVLISVKDNGSGIPQKIVDKIFQPFFTTKPTGQGTGLGLSLAYDIIKAHGGNIKAETKEEEGAEFVIEIPIKS